WQPPRPPNRGTRPPSADAPLGGRLSWGHPRRCDARHGWGSG
ncbi:hypothetical protein, partial [Arthrobacter sp. DR-2P]